MCDQAQAGPGYKQLHEEAAQMPLVSRGGTLEDSLDLRTRPVLEPFLPLAPRPSPLCFLHLSLPSYRYILVLHSLAVLSQKTEAQSLLPGSLKPHIAHLPRLRD